MPRRVLIVTGSYAPTMLADMHRARHLAWELPKLGWNVEVLAPDVSYQPPSCIDTDSTEFFATNTPVHFPRGSSHYLKILPTRSIGWRALIPMLRVGYELARNRRFDLIYISTSQFPLFLLGPLLGARFAIPFVLDFHDPGFREDKAHPTWTHPRLKHLISAWLSKYIEARAANASAGLIAVSESYIETLRRRYSLNKPSWLRKNRCEVIPFSVRPQDLEEAARSAPKKPVERAPATILYVGAGGPIMLRSFSLVCRTLARIFARSGKLRGEVRVALYGTFLGWKEGYPRHLADAAKRYGVSDVVEEYPGRVSYRRSLELLLASDGALILGVDDAGYMPSKLFSYAHSGKPLLASLHRDSPALALFESDRLGNALWFCGDGEIPSDEAMRVMEAFLDEVVARKIIDRRAKVEPYSASAMARRHAELFDACLS